jgi:hypothetical protein
MSTQICLLKIMCIGHSIVYFQVSNFDSSSKKNLGKSHDFQEAIYIIRGWINLDIVMASSIGGDPTSRLEDHKIQAEEDTWWHLPCLLYLKHSDLPPSST